ncbi:MAG: PilZ domain-containing protein [Candidatus Muiribacteriota bacterium]
MDIENRKHKRYFSNLPVKFKTLTDKISYSYDYHGNIKNISEGGIFLIATAKLNKNDMINIKISAKNLVLDLNAKVVWVKINKNKENYYGLEFKIPTSYMARIIRENIISKIEDKKI